MSTTNPVGLSATAESIEGIETIEEFSPYLKVLLYGNPGAGKTVLACRAPNPLLLDFEKGALSLKNHKELWGVKRKSVSSFEEVEEILWKLKAGANPEIETVIIDTVTELQKSHLDSILKRNWNKDKNRNPYLAFQQDYNESTQAIRRLMVAFRDLDRNLVITAHALETTNDTTGILLIRPAITPALLTSIEGLVDVMGYMVQIRDDEADPPKWIRKMQVVESRRVKAKTRLALDPILDDPTFDMFLGAKAQQVTEKEDK